MATINPPPIPRLPREWFSNPEIRGYMDALSKIIFQLWVNSASGPIEGEEAGGGGVSTLIGSIFSNLYGEFDSFYAHSKGVDYTTIGTEIVRATGALTITLNATPDDGEVAVIYHDGTTGDAVLVTDGVATDTIKVKNSVVCYVYYVDFGWTP